MFFDFKVWGQEHIPPGPKIFCSNHFSSIDPLFAITLMDEPVHMIIGPANEYRLARWCFNIAEQINALPEKRRDVIPQAINYLKKGENIYIFPEGNLNDQLSFHAFYTGVAKLHMATQAPIVPIGLVSPRRHVRDFQTSQVIGETVYKNLWVYSGNYYANIGSPMTAKHNPHLSSKEQEEYITHEVEISIQSLIHDIKAVKFWS